MFDVIVIGAGPAGTAAALTLKARGRSPLVVSNDTAQSGLAKAEVINNYPGMPRVSGAQMVDVFKRQLDDMGIERRLGRVVSIMPFGNRFMVGIGSDVEETGAVVLALGAAPAKPFPGEQELLGRGVSYCATCDGMLYKGRKVLVVGNNPEALQEAGFLAGIGCEVTYCAKAEPDTLPEGVNFLQGRNFKAKGADKLQALEVDGVDIPCDGVFVLRPALSPASLVQGLGTDGPYISVDSNMATNIPGIFAAGDCVGKPLQVAKAVGDGQLAAFSADGYLKARTEA